MSDWKDVKKITDQLTEKEIRERSLHPKLIWEKDAYGMVSGNYPEKIFRITQYKYLLKSLNENTSRFTSPWAWEDLDSIFVRSQIYATDMGCFVNQGYKHDFFCQCWQTKGDVGSMWSRFSKQNEAGQHDGIMIVSSLKDVVESIYVEDGALIFCGKVFYVTQEELLDRNIFLRTGDGGISLFLSGGAGLKSTLFLKCDYYADEDEIRFCITDRTQGQIVAKELERGTEKHRLSGIDYQHRTSYKGLICATSAKSGTVRYAS